MKEKIWIPGHYEETDKDIVIPKIGDKIYVGASYYIGHPEDDLDGRICEISRVEFHEDCLPCNRIMIGVYENPGTMHNYLGLLELKQNSGEKK